MIDFLLNPISIAMAVLTLIAPFRWVWRFWLLIAISLTELIVFSPTDPDPRIGHALGLALLVIHAYLIGGLLLARALLQFVRKRLGRSASTPGAVEARAIRLADVVLCAGGGVVAVGFVVIYLAWSFAGSRAGFFIHLLVALLSAGALAAILHSAFWRRGPFHWRIGTSAFAGSFVIMAASVGGAVYPAVVIAEARSTAGDYPYCVALTGRQRPVRSWEDLTFYSMDKSRYDNHAILLVERGGGIEPFHWSYHAREFLPGVLDWNSENRGTVACRPVADFMLDLSAFSSEELSYSEFYFGGDHLRIPSAYQPRMSNTYLSIAAVAPDFSPTPRARGNLYPSIQITGRRGFQSSVGQILRATPSGTIGNLIEVEDGLYGGTTYYRLNADGQISTLIGCYESRAREARCQHRFYRDGRMYSFDHSIESLPRSSEMEERLIDTFSSFVID